MSTAYDEKVTITSSSTLGRANKLVYGIGGTAGIVITLYPASNGDSLEVSINKADSGVGSVQVIGDGVNITFTTQYQSATIVFAGGAWSVSSTSGGTGSQGSQGVPGAQGSAGSQGNQGAAGSSTALHGTTGMIGGVALTVGTSTSGTIAIPGASAAVAAGAVILVTPNGTSVPGAGYGWMGYISGSDTILVCLFCWAIAGGTPTATTFNVKVI